MRRLIPTAIALVIAVVSSVLQRDVLADIFSRLTTIHPLGFLPLAAAALAMMLVPATHQLIAGIVLVTAVLLLHYRKYRTDTMAGEADRG